MRGFGNHSTDHHRGLLVRCLPIRGDEAAYYVLLIGGDEAVYRVLLLRPSLGGGEDDEGDHGQDER